MSDQSKFGEEAWASSLDALTLQLKTIHALRQTLDPNYRDGRHADPDGGALARKAQDFLFGLASLQLDHFRKVLEFSNAQFETVVEQLRTLGPVGTTVGQPPCTEISAQGAIGTTVSATFAIHNFRGRPADMRFLTSEFTSDQGKGTVTVPVTIRATGTKYGSVLEPFGTADFRLAVKLAEGTFSPGRYRARSYVMDKETISGVVDVVLDVAGARTAGAKKKRRARGR